MVAKIIFTIFFLIMALLAVIGMAVIFVIVFAIRDDREMEEIRENNNKSSE